MTHRTMRRMLLLLLATALLAGGCTGPQRDETGSVVAGGRESVFSLQVGDCFDDPSTEATEIRSVTATPCDEPHDNEVYFLVDHPGGGDASFPGNEAITDFAGEQCLDEFDAYVGRAYEDSDLDVFPITPTAESWADGDREVICALYAMDLSKLTGSMRGSGR